MKSHYSFSILITFTIFISTLNAQNDKTVIKGKVHKWPSDTIYIQTLPFFSPYSNVLDYTLINKDSTFSYEFTKIKKPIVFHVGSNKDQLNENAEKLLFDSLTEEHYWGFCNKFYDYGLSTHLIDNGNVIEVNLTNNSYYTKVTLEVEKEAKKYGIKLSAGDTIFSAQKTNVMHLGSNNFQNDFYQKSFTLDNILDQKLETFEFKPIVEAVEDLKKMTEKLLGGLELERKNLSPLFFNYIKSEIIFGAKKEFLKFLRFSKEEELNVLFSKEIPKEIIDIVELKASDINDATLISEEYTEYVELYLNFKMNILNKKYIVYNKLDDAKIKIIKESLPKESAYYYLSNQFLHHKDSIKRDVILEVIKNNPKGELNQLMLSKLNL